MKYLKTFENSNYEKFIVEEEVETHFDIYEILKFIPEDNDFIIIKRYSTWPKLYCDFYPDKNTKLKKIDYDTSFRCPSNVINIVFQTNYIQEAVQYVEMRLDANKYNL